MKKVIPTIVAVWLTVFFIGQVNGLVNSQNTQIKELEQNIGKLSAELAFLKIKDSKKTDGTEIRQLRETLSSIQRTSAKLKDEFEKYSSFEGKEDVFSNNMLSPTVQVRYDDNSGAGVIIKSERIDDVSSKLYIITALHVIKSYLDEKKEKQPLIVQVYSDDKKHPHNATLVKHNGELDLAVVSVVTKLKTIKPARLLSKEDISKLSLYNPVVTIGCPLGYDPIATEGRITSFKKEMKDVDYWLMNTPTVYGNSGGGVFLKTTGELIGIANMICTYDGIVSTPVYHMSIFLPVREIYDWFESSSLSYLYKADEIKLSKASPLDNK